MDIAERHGGVAGIDLHWRVAGDAPILYLHGVPAAGWHWEPFLARTGGIAPDLPGFGRSGKPADFDYTIAGYDRFIESFCDELGLERLTLVMHDWGSVGLAFAQRLPARVDRLVLTSCVPFVPGYRWHRVARAWRTRGVGEWVIGATTRGLLRRYLPRSLADESWPYFDQGTQRAILRLYRTSPEDRLAEAGAGLGRIDCPALVVHGDDDPFVPARFADDYAAALGGRTIVEHVPEAGHWPWHDDPGVVERVAAFLNVSCA